jgi:hypothetical protein
MCVSQNQIKTPPVLPLPFDNTLPHYRVVRYSVVREKNEADEMVTTVVTRVYFDGIGLGELQDFLSRYPKIDAWRAGSLFNVEKNTGGDWRKIYSPPY